jgi:cytochrome c-type biogenesis protein CcmH
MSALLLLLSLTIASQQSTEPAARSAAGQAVTTVNTPSDPELEARTSAVASQLRCLKCQGLSIEDSPSDLARNMRAVVREQLAAGKSAAEVKDYFVARYGEFVLLEPPPRGFNLAVYILPVLALLVGAFTVWFVIRRWARPGAAAAVSALTDEPEMAPWDEPKPT